MSRIVLFVKVFESLEEDMYVPYDGPLVPALRSQSPVPGPPVPPVRVDMLFDVKLLFAEDEER